MSPFILSPHPQAYCSVPFSCPPLLLSHPTKHPDPRRGHCKASSSFFCTTHKPLPLDLTQVCPPPEPASLTNLFWENWSFFLRRSRQGLTASRYYSQTISPLHSTFVLCIKATSCLWCSCHGGFQDCTNLGNFFKYNPLLMALIPHYLIC